MMVLASLNKEEKGKVHFIHLNYTNPVLDPESDAFNEVISNGYKVAYVGQIIVL
jgi:pyrroloquinoline quinone biosynthesis protein B